MATRYTYIVVDDLDGSTERVSTRRFSLDGVDYEIDLSAANSRRLDDALAPFRQAGRRLPKTRKPTRRGDNARAATRTQAHNH